jgi:hypothetical protein
MYLAISLVVILTRTPKPGLAPGFFVPAKGRQWLGFAGGAKFGEFGVHGNAPCGDWHATMNALFDQEARLFIA